MAGRLDAIVVVYQRTQFLPRLLPELQRATMSEGGRLIVVDNGGSASISGEIESLAKDAGARHIRLDRNLNYGEALNLAMLESNADSLLIAHSDAVPAPGCIDAMLQEIGKYDAVMPYTNSSHIVGAVAPLSDGRAYCSMKTKAARSKSVAGALAVDVLSSAKVPHESREVDGVDTFFLMVRRDVASALGPFNEKVFHRDARMDAMWWSQAGEDRFTAAAVGGAFCFHYGGFTLDEVFPSSEIPVRTNDLILADMGAPGPAATPDAPEDALRNCILRFDAEVRRAVPAPVFGQPIHLLLIGQDDGNLDAPRGAFDSCTTIPPEADSEAYRAAVAESESQWIMVLKSGEHIHQVALAGIKRLTNEPYDAVAFPFMFCSADGRRTLLSREGEGYPFSRVRLFRKDVGCELLPGGIVKTPEDAAIRHSGRLPGDAVLQHIFRFGDWAGKWLDAAPQNAPEENEPHDAFPTVSVPASGDRLSIAVSVATMDVRKPVHRPSRMASFGLREAMAGHPNVLSVDCYDGDWLGRIACNDRTHAIQEGHHVFLSVDEMRPPPDIKDCAKVCWLTTTRFHNIPVDPAHVASLGYEKYFVSSRRFRDEMRSSGCDCDFLPPSVSGPRRRFAKISTRCQIGILLRAIPGDWDAEGMLDTIGRLRDVDCRVFGYGWGDTGRIRRGIADSPRAERSKLMTLFDEVIPLVGSPVAAGQEVVMFSSMRCLVHVPSPQDGEWGFVPHSVCEALSAGTPVVLLDRGGRFEKADFGDAPVYIERTPALVAQRAADVASLPFDDLLILSDRAKGWAASNTHAHRAASILASLTVHPAERVSSERGSLTVRGNRLGDRMMDRIRFQAKLRGMEEVLFEEIAEASGSFSVEFEVGESILRATWPAMPSVSQIDGAISAL